jgi:hypothetical protein
MRNLRAILFPHASLPEEMLKRALSLFGPLKICRPWCTDRAVSLAEEGVIQILRPPFELEPSILKSFFQHLEEKWEERGNEAPSLTMELRAPDFSHLSFGELAEAKNRFLESIEGIAIRDSVMEFRKGVPVKSAEEALYLPGVPGKMMKIILRCFPRIPFSSAPMSWFSGKTVAFIREAHLHDG